MPFVTWINMVWAAVGIVFGYVMVKVMQRVKRVGTLRVDRSDPTEPPYLFMELEKPIKDFQNDDYVLLQVKIKNYISQK